MYTVLNDFLKQITGKSVNELEKQWYEYVKNNYID